MAKEAAAAAAPMEVDGDGASPSQSNGRAAAAAAEEDPDFLSTLPEPLRTIFSLAAAAPTADGGGDEDDDDDAATRRVDQLEVDLREHVLLSREVESLGAVWKDCLLATRHLVHRAEASAVDPDVVRKVPVHLLEDVLDVLTAEEAATFWTDVVRPSIDLLLDELMWGGDDATANRGNPAVGLPFLKLTNKLLRRLHDVPGTDRVRADVMLTTSRAYPINDRSATRVWGSHNADNGAVPETESEWLSGGTEPGAVDAAEEEESVQYTLYEAFWKLQRDFRNPNGVVVKDFLQRLGAVLRALESHAAATEAPSSNSAVVGTVPYLTHGRLLPTQLKDPDLRLSVLTQCLIVTRHLIGTVPSLAAQLGPVQDAAARLMGAAGPHGPRHLSLVRDCILAQSEEQWRQWKKNRCQPDMDHPRESRASRTSIAGRKRKRSLGDMGTLGSSEDDYELMGKKDLLQVSKTMRTARPTSDVHLEEYVEAIDPDAGIEDEYNPKKNALYTWRALRLLSTDHLDVFQRIHPEGDFEGMVRHVYKEDKGTNIPGEAPAAYEYVESSSEEEPEPEEVKEKEPRDDTKESQDADGEMEAATDGVIRSLGASPVPEVEAKVQSPEPMDVEEDKVPAANGGHYGDLGKEGLETKKEDGEDKEEGEAGASEAAAAPAEKKKEEEEEEPAKHQNGSPKPPENLEKPPSPPPPAKGGRRSGTPPRNRGGGQGRSDASWRDQQRPRSPQHHPQGLDRNRGDRDQRRGGPPPDRPYRREEMRGGPVGRRGGEGRGEYDRRGDNRDRRDGGGRRGGGGPGPRRDDRRGGGPDDMGRRDDRRDDRRGERHGGGGDRGGDSRGPPSRGRVRRGS